MGISLRSVILRVKNMNKYCRIAAQGEELSDSVRVRKGFVAVYVGMGEKTRFVIPLSYLKNPLFQKLLSEAEEEYGFDNPISGGLTFPCDEDTFSHLLSKLKNQ